MSNNKQKTAVDWLVEKMLTQDWYTYKSLEYINEAKEMEVAGKEISYADGYSEGYKRGLEIIKWNIENQLKKANENTN